ncbi:MAG TPA: ATP-binding protein, partial [Verrucomicrobiae bacterium]|nr:ATP-binding protein [Verrucomicrobiae bacterium]
MFNAKFRTKVLVPVVACMIAVMAVTAFVVNHRLTRQFGIEAKNNLDRANAIFQNSEEIRQRDLLLRFDNLPNQPLFRSLFLVGHDSPTLEKNFRDFLSEPGVDAVFYASSATNTVAAAQRRPNLSLPDFERASAPAVTRALTGQEVVDTVCVGQKLYDVVAIPVSVDQEVIGALAIGSEIGNADAREFSQLTHAEIALVAGGNIAASTLSGRGTDQPIIDFFRNFQAPPVHSAPDVKQMLFDGRHYFAIAGKFDSLSSDESSGYVLLSSYEASLGTLQTTQQVLLGASASAILLGAAVVWLLINRITRPLRELRDSAEAVGRGDYSHRVPVRSQDECGELAAVFNDMTQNIQKSRADLEQSIATLKATQEQLIQSEKLSAVGEFVAGVAHELNNPLTAVMGFSEMLREADVDSKYRRQLDLIYKAAQRCHKIVQSLLSFARRHQVERKPVSTNELVEAVLEIIAYQLRTSNVAVVTEFAPHLPAVMADGHQIQQVLLNIINNARQAIESHQSGGEIKISTSNRGETVRIAIQDNGPGIPPENLTRIFDPFFTTKEVGKGTGLGLSLCYGIIKEHGGDIKVESRRGEGATFLLELPAAAVPASLASGTRPLEIRKPDPHEGAGKKILVVDDEEPILQLIRESLSRSGYQVDTVTDGEAALRRLQQEHFDLALCDWKIPGLNGRQIYEQLRASHPELCRRIIFITGDVINERMREFLEAEKRPCLSKPFVLTDLQAAIKSAL